MKARIPLPALIIVGLTLLVMVGAIVVNTANGHQLDLLAVGIVTFLAFPVLGLLVIRQQPGNAVGWLLLGIGLNIYFIFGNEDYAAFALVTHAGSIPGGQVFAWLSTVVWIPFILMILLFLPMLFPDGRLLSPRWWVVVGSGMVFGLLAFIGNGFLPGPVSVTYPSLTNPLGIPGARETLGNLADLSVPFGAFALVGMLTSIVVRYRRGDSLLRRQLRGFLIAVVVAIIPFAIGDNAVSQILVVLLVPLVPISIALAVLRYRLYDIDVVINRALVYGALAVFITAVYVGIVVGIGALIGSGNQPNVLLSILATAVVAVAFQPVRERVRRLANRLVYGRRATPYDVMASFADRMAETLSADEVLPRMAEAAARGVGAPAARVTLHLPEGADRVAGWPERESVGEVSHALPVLYRGEPVGEIAIRKRPGESLTSSEQKLLSDLANQAGLVLHNVRLTTELQSRLDEITDQASQLRASRYRIVAARQTEQQRLEDDIRGSVQGGLESIADELRRAVHMLADDPARASALLDGLTTQTQLTLDRLRELARGVFPPLLADRGLVPALEAQVRKGTVPVSIDADAALAEMRFDPGVEAAVYFSCVEALRRATSSTAVHLTAEDGGLSFSVAGLAPEGGSMQASEDRVAALGGTLQLRNGTVSGRIPLQL